MNGNPKLTKFDDFWNELQEYLEEITTAVDECRQVDVMHMIVGQSSDAWHIYPQVQNHSKRLVHNTQ